MNPAARKRIEEARIEFRQTMRNRPRSLVDPGMGRVITSEQLFEAGYLACAREAVAFLTRQGLERALDEELATHLGIDGEKP